MELKDVVDIVVDCLKDSVDETDDENKINAIQDANEKTRLFSRDGILDSMGVVILLTDLEDKLDEDYGIVVSLADDSAMSRARSPFRTVKSLAKYILEIVSD